MPCYSSRSCIPRRRSGATIWQQRASAAVLLGSLSGKSVGNVTLTLTKNVRQGTTRTFTTQSDGQFSFATLEDASYKLSAGGPSGFAGWEQTINLQVGQVQNIAVRLGVAGSKTSVEVAADMQPAVDASTSVVGGVINAREIENLPPEPGAITSNLPTWFPAMHLRLTLIPPRKTLLSCRRRDRRGEAETSPSTVATTTTTQSVVRWSTFQKTQCRNSRSPRIDFRPPSGGPDRQWSTWSQSRARTRFTAA